MTGRNPFAVGSLLARLRNVGEFDLQRVREFGGRLVSELADRAMLIGCVLLVTEDVGGGGAGQCHPKTTIQARQARLRRAISGCARPLRTIGLQAQPASPTIDHLRLRLPPSRA